MKKEMENYISMFSTVQGVCNMNTTHINSNAGLLNVYNRYLALLDEVERLAEEQTMDRTGITIDKHDRREYLALSLEAASGIIKAHFDSVNNFEIFNSVDKSLTKLRRMRDHLIIAHGQYVLDIINNLNDVINQYMDIVAKPTLARNIKSTVTQLLEEKVKKLAIFLKNELDCAMLIIKLTHTPFYLTYRNARRVVRNGIRHREVLSVA